MTRDKFIQYWIARSCNAGRSSTEAELLR